MAGKKSLSAILMVGVSLAATGAALSPRIGATDGGNAIWGDVFPDAICGQEPPLSVSLMRADDFTNVLFLTSADARDVSVTTNGTVRIYRYARFPRGLVSAEVRVRTVAPGHLRVGASATVADGWLMEELVCPRILFRRGLGGAGADECLHTGTVFGVFRRDPFARPAGEEEMTEQPGHLSPSFVTYYNPTSMFYLAAEDARCSKKRQGFRRTKDGILIETAQLTGATGTIEMPYEVVVRQLRQTDGEPYTWEDACDLYRRWASRQDWCSQTFRERTNVPTWTKEAPVFVRFYRTDLQHPERIREWFDWFRAACPDVPVYVCCWGWENKGPWTGPDYFPTYPSDAAFREIVHDIRARGGHVWPWPSGYHAILEGRVKGGESQAVAARADIELRFGDILCRQRTGEIEIARFSWLDGTLTSLCGGTPKARRWFAEDVCGGLFDRGADAIQIDQLEGGMLNPCYAKGHGHAPGRGEWMTESIVSLAREIRAAGARRGVDVALSVEEPNEILIPHVAALDYRNGDPWISQCGFPSKGVFCYLYHEYVPLFQSNPVATNMTSLVRFAVEGQMPVYPRGTGGYPRGKGTSAPELNDFFLQWVRLYSGEARDVLMYGRHVKAPRLAGEGAEDVFVSAFGPKDVPTAVVLGNGAATPRTCSLTAFGRRITKTLQPYQLLVLKENE